MLGQLAFGDIHEDVGDLEDVIDVCLYAAPPLLYLVLVAGNLPACQRYHERERRDPRSTSKRLPPFFRRTIETFVSLKPDKSG